MFKLSPVFLTVLVGLAFTAKASQYVAEVRLYVDQSGVERWKQMLGTEDDADLELATAVLFTELNAIYESLKPKVDLKLKLKQLVLLDNNVFPTREIHQQDATRLFNEFTAKTYKKEDYDLAFLLTGADVTHPSYKALGASFFSTVCTSFGTGVSEIYSQDLLAVMVAHEMGHILGASHDEIYPPCTRDYYRVGNLMNTVIHPKSKERFTFSQCSRSYIYNKLTQLHLDGQSCLEDNLEPTVADILGKTPDESCKVLNGHNYVMNRGRYDVNYGDKFCDNLHCVARIDGKFSITKHDMPEGMPCGTNKRCSNKKCVAAEDGDPNMPDICPWGDQNLQDFGYKQPCSSKTECSTTKKGSWGKSCCLSCQKYPEVFGK